MDNPRMKQLYPTMTNGIMSDLANFDVPWNVTPSILDVGYFQHSANKLVSPLLSTFTITDSGIDVDDRTTIASLLYSLFIRKWERLWALFNANYDPLYNYNMTETESETGNMTIESANTGTITNVLDGENSETLIQTGTDTVVTDSTQTNTGTDTVVTDSTRANTGTVTDSGTDSNNRGVYGFNSSVSVGSDTENGTDTNTRTDNTQEDIDSTVTDTKNLSEDVDSTVTDTKNLTDRTTGTVDNTNTETRNLSNTEERENTVTRQTTRQGNIGVTTTQKMFESEIEIWKWNYFMSVYEDIDSICCLDIY